MVNMMVEALGIGLFFIAIFLFGFFTGMWAWSKAAKRRMPRTPIQVVKEVIENKKVAEEEKATEEDWKDFWESGGYTPEELRQMKHE